MAIKQHCKKYFHKRREMKPRKHREKINPAR
jgi:hypothetical protein